MLELNLPVRSTLENFVSLDCIMKRPAIAKTIDLKVMKRLISTTYAILILVLPLFRPNEPIRRIPVAVSVAIFG
jgi:hypothetical protein